MSKETVKTSKEVTKRLANVPKPKDISGVDAKRTQYSIKCKRKLAKYAITHNLPTPITATMAGISTGQLSAWRRDYNAGLYHAKHAVCVSRS